MKKINVTSMEQALELLNDKAIEIYHLQDILNGLVSELNFWDKELESHLREGKTLNADKLHNLIKSISEQCKYEVNRLTELERYEE